MDEPSTLAPFLDVARLPTEQWAGRFPGRRAMAYLCSYVPEEMIHAAGFTPIRLRGLPAPLRHADAHLQSFACALCRSTLDRALSGDLASGLAGTVFAHTCDAMQALADLWRMNLPDSFVDVVMQPAHLGTPAARAYLIAELQRFRQSLAALSGRLLTDGALWASIELFDETRRLMAALDRQRDRLSAADFFAVLDALQAMPREEGNRLLAGLLAQLSGIPPREGGPRLFLAGAVVDEPRLFALVDELGARVVGDDLCSGSRHFAGLVDGGDDPLAALASYFLSRPPCPSKLQPGHDPGGYLLQQVRQTGAGGVVFLLEKFCEPHAFERALSLPTLDRAGVPHLLLEMEQLPSLEGLRTRLQAFVEML